MKPDEGVWQYKKVGLFVCENPGVETKFCLLNGEGMEMFFTLDELIGLIRLSQKGFQYLSSASAKKN